MGDKIWVTGPFGVGGLADRPDQNQGVVKAIGVFGQVSIGSSNFQVQLGINKSQTAENQTAGLEAAVSAGGGGSVSRTVI